MQNYFELFDLKTSFFVDDEALKKAYQAQVTRFHPDNFVNKSQSEQLKALQNTSVVNSAYTTLKTPLDRASYLLNLEDVNPFDEKDTNMDANFLLSQIELREQLEVIKEQQDNLALDDFIEQVRDFTSDNVASISEAFTQSRDLQEIKTLVRELKFYEQLSKEANILMDEWL
jgi:molecular chaperone HscB